MRSKPDCRTATMGEPLLTHATPDSAKPDFRSYAAPSLGYALFATRWLQAPLYFGLVAAQGVYVYKFFNELWHLVQNIISGQADETHVMLAVLKLVDVVMIANLLIMVIVGGYETFVSRIGLQGHRDQPEWLSHVNSNVLKVKLATAIVGISSVHLLQMFVDVSHTSQHSLLWGTVIHMAFILSAAILAYMSGPMEWLGQPPHGGGGGAHHRSEPDTAPPDSLEPAFVQEMNLVGLRGRIPAQADKSPRPELDANPTQTTQTTQNANALPTTWDTAGAEVRISAAGFPAHKGLEDFDDDRQRLHDWETVTRLATLNFIDAHENVVFLGSPGTGKTHLAIALGMRACRAGHDVRFATATEWVTRLTEAQNTGRLTEELTRLDQCDLLVVDEIGYVPFTPEATNLLFRLISHRYERGSIIVTGDKPFGRWTEVFGDDPVTFALIDRLAHHADVIPLKGDSYRLRNHGHDAVLSSLPDGS
ncbi:IS21-like element helper ATPase IstB [Streptomyces albipurpureus]|uniref:IS21-like element helper ATPase IstB n=1 Tax=Streptomyces albipurpureus TaxID=2897419 RepID=UPI002552967F|nr:IS21-like element helper ATPase IstB [Streptomyces sp. CWNU-1]